VSEITSLNENNWGKILGGSLGFLVALILIFFGFWKGIFIIICVLAGSYIGNKIEPGDELNRTFSKLWTRDRY